MRDSSRSDGFGAVTSLAAPIPFSNLPNFKGDPMRPTETRRPTALELPDAFCRRGSTPACPSLAGVIVAAIHPAFLPPGVLRVAEFRPSFERSTSHRRGLRHQRKPARWETPHGHALDSPSKPRLARESGIQPSTNTRSLAGHNDVPDYARSSARPRGFAESRASLDELGPETMTGEVFGGSGGSSAAASGK